MSNDGWSLKRVIALGVAAFGLGMIAQWQIADYRLKADPCIVTAWDVNERQYYWVGLDDLRCAKLTEEREFIGVWIDGFEGQTFFEGRNGWVRRDEADHPPWTWLNTENTYAGIYEMAKTTPSGRSGRQFLLVFRGRQSAKPGRFGHLGVFEQLVISEKIVSAEEIFPPGGKDAQP